jgi:hypothetical protein
VPLAADTRAQVIVEEMVVDPTLRIRNLTVPPVKFIAAQVVESSASKVDPEAAVLLSFKVKFNTGSVSPTTNLIVDEYAILTLHYN